MQAHTRKHKSSRSEHCRYWSYQDRSTTYRG